MLVGDIHRVVSSGAVGDVTRNSNGIWQIRQGRIIDKKGCDHKDGQYPSEQTGDRKQDSPTRLALGSMGTARSSHNAIPIIGSTCHWTAWDHNQCN